MIVRASYVKPQTENFLRDVSNQGLLTLSVTKDRLLRLVNYFESVSNINENRNDNDDPGSKALPEKGVFNSYSNVREVRNSVFV